MASVPVRSRRVFVRADLNVPLEKNAPPDAPQIADDTRIRAALPTLEALLEAGARVVLASHLGRPKGRRSKQLSLAPVGAALEALLGRPVRFSPACRGPEALAAANALADGELLLLENLRFEPGEEKNDPEFAAALAELADVYVNDAFGTAHRAHASTAGMVGLVGECAAGLLMQSELANLQTALEPERPFLCLLGGGKVSDKLGVLEALALRADILAIGGAMAYTFLAAQGEPTGTSLVEPDRIEDALRVIDATARAGNTLLLPTDHVVAERLEDDAPSQVVRSIPDGWMGLDIGPETAARYAAAASTAKTILWNGPMGVFERKAFAHGTEVVARGVAESPGRSIVGGGDSLAAINRLGFSDRIGHLSTGGGASLEYVQGLALPGVVALDREEALGAK